MIGKLIQEEKKAKNYKPHFFFSLVPYLRPYYEGDLDFRGWEN